MKLYEISFYVSRKHVIYLYIYVIFIHLFIYNRGINVAFLCESANDSCNKCNCIFPVQFLLKTEMNLVEGNTSEIRGELKAL